jgi:alpha-tubulin suppressor-like RCC1 family protein
MDSVCSDCHYMDRALHHYRVVSISAGESHTIALTNREDVFTWGSNREGQLGREGDGTTPALLPALRSKGIRAIDAGNIPSLSLSLFISIVLHHFSPHILVHTHMFLSSLICSYISLGGQHNLAVSGEGILYAWGCGDCLLSLSLSLLPPCFLFLFLNLSIFLFQLIH